MRIVLAAVGKAKASPERELFHLYCKRLPWPVTVKEVEEKRPLPVLERKDREAELLLAACKAPSSIIIALDERGKSLTSKDFAATLKRYETEAPQLCFLIGGADGHGEAVKKAAHLLLSFGHLTWPHMLVRAMLAEQLYRAHSILTQHPYHRE